MMGLRDYINNNDFSKKVNLSKMRQRFENSDFARSVEAGLLLIKDDYSKKHIDGTLFSTLGLPISFAVTYVIAKMDKKTNTFSGFYEKFSNSPLLVFNH